MPDPIHRFEILVLRPIHVILGTSCLTSLFYRRWWWVGACILSFFLLGIIGSQMHPLQSSSDLLKGPLSNPAAAVESEALSPSLKAAIVSRACTKVGLLVFSGLTLTLIFVFNFRWYLALLISWIISTIVGGVLKFVFNPSLSGT